MRKTVGGKCPDDTCPGAMQPSDRPDLSVDIDFERTTLNPDQEQVACERCGNSYFRVVPICPFCSTDLREPYLRFLESRMAAEASDTDRPPDSFDLIVADSFDDDEDDRESRPDAPTIIPDSYEPKMFVTDPPGPAELPTDLIMTDPDDDEDGESSDRQAIVPDRESFPAEERSGVTGVASSATAHPDWEAGVADLTPDEIEELIAMGELSEDETG